MGLTVVRQQHLLDHGFFPWFVDDEVKDLIGSFMSLWQDYCQRYTPEQKVTHWPGSNEKIGYKSKFNEKGELLKESLLLSINFIESLSEENRNDIAPSIFIIESFIEKLYEKSINKAPTVLNVCDVDVSKIMRDSMNSAVLHFSHYLPNGKDVFSEPHFKKGYGAFLLAESGDNMEIFMNKKWELIGLNEGQILCIPGIKLDECTKHEIPALKHRIIASDKGRFAMKLFPDEDIVK